LIIRFAGDSVGRAGRFDRRRERNANCTTYSHNKCTEIRLRQLTCREGGCMLPVRTCSPASRSVGLRSLLRVCLEWLGDFAPLKFLPLGWIEHQNVAMVAQFRKTGRGSQEEFAR